MKVIYLTMILAAVVLTFVYIYYNNNNNAVAQIYPNNGQLPNPISQQYGTNPRFDSRETVVYIGSTKIEAFPSNNQGSLRGLTNVKMLLVDEFAHFQRKDMQLETKTIMERMKTKEGTLIVAISTPGLYMDDVMFEMLHDPHSNFHKVEMDYRVALYAGLYTSQEIEIAKRSSSFDREFALKWGSGAIGSFLHPQTIADILKHSNTYDPDDANIWQNPLVQVEGSIPTYAGLDIGYGSSSNSAITIVQVLQGNNEDVIRVVYSSEYKQYTPYDLVAELNRLMQKYKVWNVFVDASAPEIIRQIKAELNYIGDNIDYEHDINRHRTLPTYDYILKNKGKVEAELAIRSSIVIVPVNFGIAHRWLTSHTRELCSITPSIIQIAPKFKELINSLESAVIDDRQKYIKASSNYTDIFDSFRLALCGVDYNSEKNL